MHISSVAGISAPTLVSAGIAAPPQHCVAIFLSQRQQNPKRFQAEWQMTPQNYNQAHQRGRRSQPSIGAPQLPQRLAIRSAIRMAGWRKFVPRQDAIGTGAFGNDRIRGETATERYQTETRGSRSPPVQRLRPYFSPNLRPILGVPVRRLWK